MDSLTALVLRHRRLLGLFWLVAGCLRRESNPLLAA
jgi:hypothetical protein